MKASRVAPSGGQESRRGVGPYAKDIDQRRCRRPSKALQVGLQVVDLRAELTVAAGQRAKSVLGRRFGAVHWGNELSGPVPTWLSDMTNLEGLSLDNNQLTGPIPSQLGDLTLLERLTLNNNRLTGDIPSELGNLTKLERLWLAGNQLTGCVPATLQGVAENDFDNLGLQFCGN